MVLRSVLSSKLDDAVAKKIRIVWDEDALAKITKLPEIKDVLLEEADKVAREAQATAQDAQGGPGGRLAGYAEAGFSVVYNERSRRPSVDIVSNANPEMTLRVYFASQKKWGVSHLRRALYKFAISPPRPRKKK